MHYLVRWKDYDHTYETWEPDTNITDKKLVREFIAPLQVSTSVESALDAVRRETLKSLMHKRRVELSLTTSIPAASNPDFAAALLGHFSRAPSVTSRASPSFPKR